MTSVAQSSAPTLRILCGGDSPERDVSLRSGAAVYQSLIQNFDAELIQLDTNYLPERLNPETDLIIPIIHGTYGEDGRIQAELEEKGFTYCGSDLFSSVVAFDKLFSKALAERVGIPTAKDLVVDNLETLTHFDFPSLGSRFVCKPRRQGSSVGVFIAEQNAPIDSAKIIKETSYLLEAYVEGIDVTVGVLQDEALGVIGIRPINGFYDYDNKYVSGRTIYDVPAQIDESVSVRLRNWAMDIFKICGCRDFARVDFRISTSGEPIFLEINTIPGLTETSLLPKSASINGYNFDDLMIKMIEPSLKRFNNKVAL